MNKKRLLRVAKLIEDNPDTYDQSEWCGTQCCVAGHAVWEYCTNAERALINTAIIQTEDTYWKPAFPFEKGTKAYAQEILDLTESEADDLFLNGSWTGITAKSAAKAIRKMCKNGKVTTLAAAGACR